jgi:hypothetical protein
MKGRHWRSLGPKTSLLGELNSGLAGSIMAGEEEKTLILEGLNSSLAGSIIVGVREMDDLIERPAALQTIMEGTR